MDQHRKRQFQITGGYWLLALAALLLLQSALLKQSGPKDVPGSGRPMISRRVWLELAVPWNVQGAPAW